MTDKSDRKKRKVAIVDESAAEEEAEGTPDTDELPEVSEELETTGLEVGERDFPAELEAKDAEYAELRDRHLRLVAEFDNFRKRTAKERREIGVRSQAELLTRLLDALDDLGRVAHLDPEQTSAGDIVEGVELVERKIFKELEELGLEPVGEVGEPFDPNHHEAIGTVALENEGDDNTVAVVLQTGYRVGPVLLRPARVQVYM